MFDDVRDETEVNLLPKDEEHSKQVEWCRAAFIAAQNARMQYEEAWLRYYKVYRLHMDPTKGWRSRGFIPMIFQAVQSILPKIIAQLPSALVEGVSPMDEVAAPKMEDAIRWAGHETKLQLRLFEQFWSALVYGTGILRVRAGERTVTRHTRIPVMKPLTLPMPGGPVMDPETGMPMMDINGQPMMDAGTEAQLGELPTGRTKVTAEKVPIYIGPVADYIDIFNIYPAPEASDTIDARYLIHREWVASEWVQEQVKAGFYKLPEGFQDSEYWVSDADDPKFKRLSRIGYGGSRSGDRTTKMCQLWDVYRREGDSITVTTMLNERYIIRKVYSPYDHGYIPFTRCVDHLVPGEFWGQGEAEVLRDLQDLENTIWNARVDELKLKLRRMFMVDEQALVDPREVTNLRPGSFIRLNNPNGLPIQNIIAPIELGDVIGNAYAEAAEVERMAEKVSGTSPATTGTGEVQPADTATSVAIFAEAGNARLTMKTRVAELSSWEYLMEMYGVTLQQFCPPDMLMRVMGKDGPEFEPIGEEIISGAFRFTIQAESSTVTESVRKDQAMGLLQAGAQLIDPMTGMPVANIPQLWKDLVNVYGKKDTQRYVFTPPPPPPMMGGEGLPPELAALAGAGPPGAPPEMNGGAPPA